MISFPVIFVYIGLVRVLSLVIDPKGSSLYIVMFFMKRSFSIAFQVLEHMNLIDDLPDSVLYVGSFRDTLGRL